MCCVAPPTRLRPRTTLVLVASWLLVSGCASTAPTITLTPAEQMALRSRSIDLLLRAAESRDDAVAANAIEALVKVAPREGLPLFRKAISSAAPMIRYAGFVALGELRDCTMMHEMAAGARDSHRLVQLAAAFAAYRCGKQGAGRILAQTLTDSPEEGLRADAAALIGRLNEPRTRRWLEAALRVPVNERSSRVTLQIHAALSRLGVDSSTRELINYSQGTAATRTDALLLLARIGDPQAYEAFRYRLHTPHEDYAEARLIAARGLGVLGSGEGFEFALQMLSYTDPNPQPGPDVPNHTFVVRSLAAHALAEIGDPRALDALRQLATPPADERLQVAACYSICRILDRHSALP